MSKIKCIFVNPKGYNIYGLKEFSRIRELMQITAEELHGLPPYCHVPVAVFHYFPRGLLAHRLGILMVTVGDGYVVCCVGKFDAESNTFYTRRQSLDRDIFGDIMARYNTGIPRERTAALNFLKCMCLAAARDSKKLKREKRKKSRLRPPPREKENHARII